MLPSFIIAGAYRSGTTTLRRWLDAHPAVAMPALAEPSFFAFGGDAPPAHLLLGDQDPFHRRRITTLAEYEALFAELDADSTTGECSPEYLRQSGSAARIAATIPGCRIILSLRHPADRLISDWRMCTRDGVETLGLREALDEEGNRPGFGNHYSATSRISVGLGEFLTAFDRDQLLVLVQEEWTRDPTTAASAIAAFLDIDPAGFGDLPSRRNAGGVPTSRVGRTLWSARRRAAPILGTRIPAPIIEFADRRLTRLLTESPVDDVRDELLVTFRVEVERIESLLDRRIEAWHR